MRPLPIALACLLAASAAAQERTPDGAIAEARTMLRSFEYERAIERLDEVLRSSGAQPVERITAHELRAVFFLLLGREEDARASAERMLNLDPGHRPSDPSYSPVIVGFFDVVRREFVPSPAVELTVDTPSEVGSGERAEIDVTIASGEGVERVMAYMRRAGEGEYRRMPLERRSPTRFAGMLPRFHTTDELSVELYFEARAPSGFSLAAEGSAQAPRLLRVVSSLGRAEASAGAAGGAGEEAVAQPGEPFYGHWLFWTIVGAVVVAGVAIGVGVAASSGGGARVGNLGTAQLAIH